VLRLGKTKNRSGLELWCHTDGHVLWATVNHLSTPTLTTSPCELFGFNTGNFEAVSRAFVMSDAEPKIPFRLSFDTDMLVIVRSTGEKELMTVADAVYDAFVKFGVPQISIEGHELSQKTVVQDAHRISSHRGGANVHHDGTLF
jgi:hypothetical protein